MSTTVRRTVLAAAALAAALAGAPAASAAPVADNPLPVCIQANVLDVISTDDLCQGVSKP